MTARNWLDCARLALGRAADAAARGQDNARDRRLAEHYLQCALDALPAKTA